MQEQSPWLVFTSLLIGVLIILEAAAFQVPAMPYITRFFGLPTSYAGAITLFYYASAIVFAPVMGRLGDQIGRKQMILIGFGIFIVSEFMAALSSNMACFFAARFIQGLGYACVFPTVLAFINELFDERSRGKAVGLLGAAAMFGAATGGIIAGMLVDRFGWSSIYWVSGILATLGTLLVGMLVPPTAGKGRQPLDLAGVTALLVTVVSLISLPILVGNLGWSSWITITMIALAIVGLNLLVLAARHAPNPVIDIKVLALPGVYMPAILATLQNFCLICFSYTIAFYVASVAGWGATQVGLIGTLNYLLGSVGTAVLGGLTDRFSARRLAVICCGGALLGAWSFTFIGAGRSLAYIIASMGLIGFFGGAINATLMKIVINDVPADRKGVGTGTYAMFRDLGVPFGSTFGLVLYGLMVDHAIGQAVAHPESYALSRVGYVVMGVTALVIVLSLLLLRKDPAMAMAPRAQGEGQ